jgi:cytochrome c-type biogenesis protein CcmH
MMRVLLLWLLAFAVWAADPVALDAQQELRYQALSLELRCLVCQNQNIADSHAPLAEDLRNQVRTQLAAGRSDEQIKQYMTDRYGDFVLYKPPFKWETMLLWLGPALLVMLGLSVALLRLRRRTQDKTSVAPDAEQLKKLLDENS